MKRISVTEGTKVKKYYKVDGNLYKSIKEARLAPGLDRQVTVERKPP